MAAAAQGAALEGGQVLGILPGDDPDAAAAGVSIPLPTGLGEVRNALVVKASEALIVVAGGWGTVNEAALCMKIGRPLVGVHDTIGDRFEIERLDDPAAAVAYARRAIRADPWREEPHRELMRAYGAMGEPETALRQYRDLVTILRDELGEQPSAATRRLAREMMQLVACGIPQENNEPAVIMAGVASRSRRILLRMPPADNLTPLSSPMPAV